MEVDWALVQRLVTEVKPKKFLENADGYKVFRHSLDLRIEPQVYEILDADLSYSTKVNILPVDNTLVVIAPQSLLEKPKTTKKRKSTATASLGYPKEFLIRVAVSEDTLDDFLVFKECTRLNSSLVEQIGPFIALSQGHITVNFGLHLTTSFTGGISQNATGQNHTAARLFARVLDMPQLLLPPDPENDLKNMFEALTTPKEGFSNEPFVVPGVITSLQKFQCRTVRWCLFREGSELIDGKVRPTHKSLTVFGGWYKAGDSWINPYSSMIQPIEPEPVIVPYGGLLAEEMGLGKTLEVISLIKLHPRTEYGTTVNESTGQVIEKIGATLVIIPSGIAEQWVAELKSHSPGINVIEYTGKLAVTPEKLAAADVVLASYATISAEIYSALFNPRQRNTRFWEEREDIRAVRSPLVQVQFWRVILDEVQTLRGGVNNAARVAGLIPRVNGWAVTGTPVKNSMDDLRGQLEFLKIPHFASKRAFERILTMPEDFKNLVSAIGIRHTKFMLRDELKLPPQRRRLMMLEFNDMERLFYESVREDYTIPNDQSKNALRNLLVKLRQACCITSTSGEGSIFNESNGATLTVDQAVRQLLLEGETKYTRLVRNKVSLLIDISQISLAGGSEKRQSVVDICQKQIEFLDSLIQKSIANKQKAADANKQVTDEIEKEKAIIAQMSHDLELLGQKIAGLGLDPAAKDLPPPLEKIEVVDVTSNPEFARKRYEIIDRETALEDLTIKSHYHAGIIKSELVNIHACKELLHRAYFFAGVACFRMGNSSEVPEEDRAMYAAQETAFHAKAEEILGDLLGEQKAEFLSVRNKLKEPPMFFYEDCDNIYETFFNEQGSFMKELYHDLVSLLQQELLEADPNDGDMAYAATLDTEAKSDVLRYKLADMVSLREKILEGSREVKKSNKRSLRETKTKVEHSETSEDFEAHLRKRVSDILKPIDTYELAEKKRVEKANNNKFKSMDMSDRKRKELGFDLSTDSNDLRLESVKTIAYGNADTLMKDCRAWKREMKTLTEVSNARSSYFKSLQILSDRVAIPETTKVEDMILRKENLIKQADVDIENASSRLKFIAQIDVQLPGERESKGNEEAEECVICQETYVHGSFTTCGHRCCTTCLRNWLAQNPRCPLCKTTLAPGDVFQFKYGDDTGDSQNIRDEDSKGDKRRKDGLSNDVYEHVSSARFNQIMRQPLKKTYGIKIDTIVRHIILLKQEDPSVQIVIFTQWNSMLQGLTRALLQHEIRAMRKAQRNSVTQFRTDSDITCFMLHTSNDSAGLTLTNATHVILCEPLLTTAVELQAISRIHRIGQTLPTTVWLFAIQDTVEQQILSLATERRVGLAKENHQSDEVFESEVVTSTVGNLVDRSSGSEIIVEADMRRILDIQ